MYVDETSVFFPNEMHVVILSKKVRIVEKRDPDDHTYIDASCINKYLFSNINLFQILIVFNIFLQQKNK